MDMDTYKIQANASATRRIPVNESHPQTIKKYALLKNLIDSNGIIDEPVLDKLRLNIRAILEAETATNRELLDLCLDVIYHQNMKAYGLYQLVMLYIKWDENQQQEA